MDTNGRVSEFVMTEEEARQMVTDGKAFVTAIREYLAQEGLV